MQLLIVVCMLVVIAAFFALAVTERRSVAESRPGLRRAALIVWLVIVVVGWAVFGYLAFVAPGGLDAAWEWVRDQTLLYQIAMWLFLLPWMGALWISQTGWAEWLRVALIAGVALLTFVLALTQFPRTRG